MTIKFTPLYSPTPTNQLNVKLEFMHGDADVYTNKTFKINITSEITNKEEHIERIMNCIMTGLELIDNYDTSPFVVGDNDWNDSNCDEETGIPKIGSIVQFLTEIDHMYWKEPKIYIGTVIDANDKTVTVEFENLTFVVPNNENYIAPESSIAINRNGNEFNFCIDGSIVCIETEGDCTTDYQMPAVASIELVEYYNENGELFNVSGF